METGYNRYTLKKITFLKMFLMPLYLTIPPPGLYSKEAVTKDGSMKMLLDILFTMFLYY